MANRAKLPPCDRETVTAPAARHEVPDPAVDALEVDAARTPRLVVQPADEDLNVGPSVPQGHACGQLVVVRLKDRVVPVDEERCDGEVLRRSVGARWKPFPLTARRSYYAHHDRSQGVLTTPARPGRRG